MEKATGVLQVFGGIFGIIAALLFALQFAVGGAIFANRTSELAGRFNESVLPLVVIADTGNQDINEAIRANDNAAFERAVFEFVEEKELQGKVLGAVEASEALINCHKSYLCFVDEYEDYEQPMRRLWYSFRPVIVRLRGDFIPDSYGATLEKEAKRILDADRARKYLPSP